MKFYVSTKIKLCELNLAVYENNSFSNLKVCIYYAYTANLYSGITYLKIGLLSKVYGKNLQLCKFFVKSFKKLSSNIISTVKVYNVL